MSDVIIVNIEEPIQNNDIELTTHNEKENISPNEKTDVELIRQPSENLEKTDIQLIPCTEMYRLFGTGQVFTLAWDTRELLACRTIW